MAPFPKGGHVHRSTSQGAKTAEKLWDGVKSTCASSHYTPLQLARMWNVKACQHMARGRPSTDVSWIEICMSPFASNLRLYSWAWDVVSTSEYVPGIPRLFSVFLTAGLSYWCFASSSKQRDFRQTKIVKFLYMKIDLKYFMALDTGLSILINFSKNLNFVSPVF